MDVNQSNNRSIYLYCHPVFNAFFVWDKDSNDWITSSYEHIYDKKYFDVAELKTWLLRNMAIFNSNFNEVIIAIDSKNFLLLPSNIEEEMKLSLLDRFQNPIKENDVVLSQKINNESVVYTIPKEIYEVLNDHFEQKEFIFGDTGLILFSRKKENKIIAQIYENSLSITYHSDGILQYYNRFECQDSSDFLYYILLAFKSLHLDPQKEMLLIGGLIEEDAPLFKEIWSYIENIEVTKNTQSVYKSIPEHYFFNILNLPK